MTTATAKPEPGQVAYEARFEGYTLGPRGVSDAWEKLQPEARAKWERVEAAVLAAAPGPVEGGRAVPSGWKLVPEDPTPKMIAAANQTSGVREMNDLVLMYGMRNGRSGLSWSERGEEPPILQAWRAMLGAAHDLVAVEEEQQHG